MLGFTLVLFEEASEAECTLKNLCKLWAEYMNSNSTVLHRIKEKYNDSYPLDYFLRGKGQRNIHPETSDFLEKLLTMLKEHGEDATFKYLKELKEY